jgi:hypothetical protein
MVEPVGKKQDRLSLRCFHHGAGVGGHLGPARQNAQINRFEMGEEGQIPFDSHCRLPTAERLAIRERTDVQFGEFRNPQIIQLAN